MLLVKKGLNGDINQMLKEYKRKQRNTRLKDEINKRKHYTKPSVKRRNEILDAEYRDKTVRDMNG